MATAGTLPAQALTPVEAPRHHGEGAPVALVADKPRPARGRVAGWRERVVRAMALTDGVGATVAAGSLVLTVPHQWAVEPSRRIGIAVAAVAVLGVWLLALHRARRRGTVAGAVASSAGVFAATCAVVVAAGIDVPRAVLVVPFVVGTMVILGGRLAVARWFASQRKRGRYRRSVLLVGDADSLGRVGGVMLDMGATVVGACAPDRPQGFEIACTSIHPGPNTSGGGDDRRPNHDGIRTLPVLGPVSRVADLAVEFGVDEVAIVPSAILDADVRNGLMWSLDRAGVPLSVLSPLDDVAASRIRVERTRGVTLLHVTQPRYRGALSASKRVVDVVGGAILLLLASLPMAAIAIAVKVTSPGPALFRQQRVGLDGRPFRMLKFRSMVVDAESQQDALSGRRDAGNLVLFKMKDDPRVTRVGRVLRRVSLDELPQLINVVRGEMSLVGPRPALPSEVAKYDTDTRRRLLVKPGITGLWQVSGRSDLTWAESSRLDRSYVENWSLASDAGILLRTVRALKKGAY